MTLSLLSLVSFDLSLPFCPQWEMRKAELQEESAAYEKALANIQRQMEERAKEAEHILRAAGVSVL